MNDYLQYYEHEKRPAGARKYYGEVASNYDAKRESSQKWKDEQRIIEEWIREMRVGQWVLDCPCGTGRFVTICEEMGVQYDGIDQSEDMLEQAKIKRADKQKTRLSVGDATKLKRKNNSRDVCMMIRLSRWLDDEQRIQALKEMQRVARHRIILTARVRDHPRQWTYEAIMSALDGWKISRDEMAGDENYRVIMLEPE